MKVCETDLPGVLVVELDVYDDPRGCFAETYHKDRYAEIGIDIDFKQDNMSRSVRGTLRGLHYQIEHPQGKLVQVLRGEVFDVAVDLRRDSPAFGQWTGVRLNGETMRQLYVPPGFAHGFYVLSETAEMWYKCSDLYHAEHERTLLWNDPQLGIVWPLDGSPLLSEKDNRGQRLADAECYESVESRELRAES
jgi:dTDP-4-dehydrorhamnose 3,5-epimerase